MQKTLFVANLDETVDDVQLENLFSPYGKVVRARVWLDLETGRPRGFGFVEMLEDYEADVALECVDGRLWRGRRLKVSVARPRRN